MLETYQPVLIFLVSFAIVALASRQIGHYFKALRLPLISGFRWPSSPLPPAASYM
jgi:hypothetical protein